MPQFRTEKPRPDGSPRPAFQHPQEVRQKQRPQSHPSTPTLCPSSNLFLLSRTISPLFKRKPLLIFNIKPNFVVIPSVPLQKPHRSLRTTAAQPGRDVQNYPPFLSPLQFGVKRGCSRSPPKLGSHSHALPSKIEKKVYFRSQAAKRKGKLKLQDETQSMTCD